MTAAQKTAKAKFKQAIAYRQKTGVSLKEAFAHIYGKKVGAVKKPINTMNIKIVSGVGNIESSVSNILGIKVGIKKINNIDAVSLKLYDISNKKTIVVISIYNTQKDIKNEIAPDFSAYIFKNTRESGFTNKETEIINKKILNYCNSILQEVKNLNKNVVKAVTKKVAVKKPVPKKKTAKKVVRKVVKKKAVPKKKVAKKKLTRKDYDKRFQAYKPGKRTSASGNTYYEYRENRSDRGKLLGIGKVSTQSLQAVKGALIRLNEYKTNLERMNNSLKMSKQFGFNKNYISQLKNNKKRYMDLIKETKTHISQLKKHI